MIAHARVDILLDVRDRKPRGISRFGVESSLRAVPLLHAHGIRVGVLCEQHQQRTLAPLDPFAQVIVSPHVEKLVRFDDSVLSLIESLKPRHLHSYSPFVDPRVSASFSVTIHDLIRFDPVVGKIWSDEVFLNRYGHSEMENLQAATNYFVSRGENQHPRLMETYLRSTLAHAETASFISTPSHHVQMAVQSIFPNGIVSHNAAELSERFFVESPDVARSRIPVGVPDRYVLFVGTPTPHKRLDVIADSWPLVQSTLGLEKVPIVVAGDEAGVDIFEQISHPQATAELILRLGYVDDEVLRALYRLAEVVVVPSRVEGFGYPVDEARLSGGRVVANRIPVFEERWSEDESVGFFDLNDPTSLLRAVSAVCLLPSGQVVRDPHVGGSFDLARRLIESLDPGMELKHAPADSFPT